MKKLIQLRNCTWVVFGVFIMFSCSQKPTASFTTAGSYHDYNKKSREVSSVSESASHPDVADISPVIVAESDEGAIGESKGEVNNQVETELLTDASAMTETTADENSQSKVSKAVVKTLRDRMEADGDFALKSEHEMEEMSRRERRQYRRQFRRELRTELRSLNASDEASDNMLLLVIITILIPPLGVALVYGLSTEFWISLILTLLGYLPGLIYSLIVILR